MRYKNSITTLPQQAVGGWQCPVLIATMDDGSVWELPYGAKEWKELPPPPGTKRWREINDKKEAP